MKIVFFTRLFYPHRGGVEKHVYEISKRLKKEGHDVTIFTEDIPEAKNYKDEFHVIRLKVGKDDRGKKDRIWKALWKYNDLIFHADIVHCHDVFFWYLPFKILRPFKKVYTTFHGYETHFPPKKNAIMVRKVSELLSTGTINVGKFISKWYHSHPTYVTYGGVDGIDESKMVPPGKRLKILFVGRIEEDNSIYVYNEVLHILSTQGIDFEFTALGDGSLRKEFQRWGEVRGFVEKPREYIKKADIIFASSYLSILDSLAEKKVVMSIYQNELKKDYLKMSPIAKYITIASEPTQIAVKIKHFRSDPSSFSTAINDGFDWVSTQTWENVVEVYKKLWKIN